MKILSYTTRNSQLVSSGLSIIYSRNIKYIIIHLEHTQLGTLIINELRAGIKVCAIKAPRFGENRKANLQDLVILTAGELRSTIEQSTSDYDRKKLQERLAKLSVGVAVLKNEDHLNDKAKQEVTTEEDGDKNTEEREGKQSLSEKGEKAVGKEVKAARSQKGDSAKHEVIDKELLQVDDLRSDDDPNVFLVNNFQDPLQVIRGGRVGSALPKQADHEGDKSFDLIFFFK
ncbi:hypothetical protein E2562_035218 [Oryza meyeriana var. granulata]|uniref:Uncharacterized protein n=1 Tax=Oryza meyeriana var. granulata TaxID=110450 RepID=A0A6G1DST1_9ORYZ|nr:hypothetical protein E2562_035218 [Oryza meyeriana var. granulata]KAF0915273.1 hypothetical protein E2562_035218 [Oryza meyeriana var. granulata]